jgi:xanthine dehydrogenase accessory factor
MGRDTDGTPKDVAGDAAGFYARVADLLAARERVALCAILRRTGSGPRRAGAKMLVRDGGGSEGTVGGGVLERKATAYAREVLRTGQALCRAFALDLEQASDEGMTCGGEVEVLVECLDGTAPSVQDFFARVAHLLARGERACLTTAISRDGDAAATDCFLAAGGRSVASLSRTGHALPEDLLHNPAAAAPYLVERGTVRYFVESLAPPVTVYIFGGGHIGARLVPLCHLLGFRTVVVDDRAEFASRDRFPLAGDVIAAPSFDRIIDDLPIGEDSYVVIVTRGHGGDQAILRQVLRRRPGYIGMIGSRRKRGLIFEQLAREGCTPDDLSRVHCPIGLPVGAETPEEIAVSIAAELIAARAGRGGEA